MDLFCNLDSQSFHWNFRAHTECGIILTQNDDQPIRLYLLRGSRNPGGLYPFMFDVMSGAAGPLVCVISLRDTTAFPIPLGSTDPLAVIPNGFSGVFHLNTGQIGAFLGNLPERQAAFCVDIVDADGHKISPFRRNITLRSIGAGGTGGTFGGLFYMPNVSAYVGVTPPPSIALEAVPSIGVPMGSVYWVIIDGGDSRWRLENTTLATNVPQGIIKLLDTGLNLIRVGGL